MEQEKAMSDISNMFIEDSPDNATIDSHDKLKYLTTLIEKLGSKKTELKEAEEVVERITEEIRHLSGVVIPGIFDELGVKKITLQNGKEVKIHSEWVGSISKDNSLAAYSWLEDNGHGSIIKKTIDIGLKKGESETAKKIREWLIHEKIFSFKEGSSVHHSTLKSFINEQKEKGSDLPDELFGTFQVKETKVK
jgi:hypothetical protein